MNGYLQTLIMFCLLVFLMSCSSENRVRFNEGAYLEIEVYSDFVDPGVSVPEGYVFTCSGYVNTFYLGDYQIVYEIFNDKGESVKELTRFIKVVDTTAPTITIPDDLVLYFGVAEPMIYHNCVIDDNYYSNDNIIIQTNINEVIDGYAPGFYDITISLTDPSGNSVEQTINIEFKLDILVNFEYFIWPDEVSSVNFLNGDKWVVNYEDNDTVFRMNTNYYFYCSYIFEDDNYEYSFTIQGFYGELDHGTLYLGVYQGSNQLGVAVVYELDLTLETYIFDLELFDSISDRESIDDDIYVSSANEYFYIALSEFKDFIINVLGVPYN